MIDDLRDKNNTLTQVFYLPCAINQGWWTNQYVKKTKEKRKTRHSPKKCSARDSFLILICFFIVSPQLVLSLRMSVLQDSVWVA